MKKILTLLALATLSLMGCSAQTIDQAIQSEWKSTITVVMVEKSKNGVIFKDNDQYIFNTFEKTDDRFNYSTDGEDGFRFSGGADSLLVRTIYREGIGDIVWGILHTNKQAKEVQLTFHDKKHLDHKIFMKIPIVNHAFIGYPPDQLYRSEIEAATNWKVQAVIVDQDGNIVMERTY